MSITLEKTHPTGLVEITNDAYHAGPGISKSHLDAIAEQSPLHYWYEYENPDRPPREETEALCLGSAIHSAILEPDLFTKNYIASPPFNRRTNDGKKMFADFCEENQGKGILLPAEYDMCIATRDAVHRHPVAAGLLRNGRAEQSFYAYDQETGELIKCRFDFLHDGGGMAIDLKSANSAAPARFAKDAANFRYDIAPAWYFDVLRQLYGERPKHWVWLVVEKEPPYAVGLYYARVEDIERAHNAARRDFMRIVNCRRANDWPDYAHNIDPLELPAWAKR
ncbi:PD-(D/E)XK nuclease-like domain-containing protein [Paraburkholderia phenoliruptrix]|uniref:PD-(D/E)XK nuclease-like domain-containing protein n=1 Tax=Paraburkholderia phenoliruptrix TaxID=252970 RepID=UPI0034CE383B